MPRNIRFPGCQRAGRPMFMPADAGQILRQMSGIRLFLHPAHHAAQFLADLFDQVLGLHTALCQEVDLAATLELIDFHNSTGVKGIAVLGTTAEFVHLDFEERSRLIPLAVKRAKIPVVAGISYEFLRYSARHLDKPLIRVLIAPGLALQRLTTREPDLSMLECAIAALTPVLAADGIEVAQQPASRPTARDPEILEELAAPA